MKKIIFLSLIVFGALSNTIKTDSYTLTIKSESLKNSEDTIMFALYNK